MSLFKRSQCWRRLCLRLLLLNLTVMPVSLLAEESETWTQWRGPSRDGIVHGKTWPTSLSKENLKTVWSYELQPGYSTPVVTEDRVFVTETRDEKTERVLALNRKTGEKIWEAEWPGALSVPFFAKANGDWIRASPAYDGTNLYVAGIRDVLVCLDGESGAEKWRIDFPGSFNAAVPAFGFASSPLVTEDAVYVQAGESVVRVNKASGEVVWKTLEDGGGMSGSAFSSPIIDTLHGVEQLIVQTRSKLAGVDLATGTVLWSQEVEAFRGMNILTPVVWKNHIFTSSYGGGSFLFDISLSDGAWSVKDKWRNKVQGYMSTPVVIEDHAYLHLRNQRVACLDLKTGQEAWISKPFGKYWSLVAQGEQVLALDEEGDLRLIQASPDELQVSSNMHICESPSWAHLVVCGEELFVRELNKITSFEWK